ncbi:hypothetical protein [Candidatus Sororendozoicomonas aggregata]|uniref:hypothetical protein n=1 Tax=Candidatus Sororendozoicomonas aggregata TaxID=3073239 RepID=UPI002ED56ECA
MFTIYPYAALAPPVQALSDRYESRGSLTFAFKNHLIQLINTEIVKEAKPPGHGMSKYMYVDLARANYYVGGKLVTKKTKNSDEDSFKEWQKLTSEEEFSWVTRNIEALSVFLNQSLVALIFRAISMSGNSMYQGKNIAGFAFISKTQSLNFMVYPDMRVEFAVTSDVHNFVAAKKCISTEESSFFTMALTLHFDEIKQATGNTLLQARFDCRDNRFSNRCHMCLIPKQQKD